MVIIWCRGRQCCRRGCSGPDPLNMMFLLPYTPKCFFCCFSYCYCKQTQQETFTGFSKSTADISAKCVLADALQWVEQMTLKDREEKSHWERKKRLDGFLLKPKSQMFCWMCSSSVLFRSSYLFGWAFSLKIRWMNNQTNQTSDNPKCLLWVLVFTCVWMCWIMVPVLQSLVVSSAVSRCNRHTHSFPNTATDAGSVPLPSKIVQAEVEGTAKQRLITPPSLLFLHL